MEEGEVSEALQELLKQTWWDQFLHYGLLLGAVFQLIAIAAIVFLRPASEEDEGETEKDGEESRDEGVREAHGVSQPPRRNEGVKKRRPRKKR